MESALFVSGTLRLQRTIAMRQEMLFHK